MTAFLQIGKKTLTARDIVDKLYDSKLLPKFLEGIILDEAIAEFSCTDREIATLNADFFAGCSEEEKEAWLRENGLTREVISQDLIRKLKISKFKAANWGDIAERYFFERRKQQLDCVIYSIICHQNYDLIQELYFRLLNKEQSFAELASQYSQTPEAKVKGIIGPIELGQIPDNLAKLLMLHTPGNILTGTVGDYYALLQLESIIPAKFDRSMRERMIDELFQQWLRNEVWNLKLNTISSSVGNS